VPLNNREHGSQVPNICEVGKVQLGNILNLQNVNLSKQTERGVYLFTYYNKQNNSNNKSSLFDLII
jgi:hypothetical protein